jgi:hypothetical protein
MPQRDSQYFAQLGRKGLLATSDHHTSRSLLNPLVSEVWTVAVGGTATDGVYSFILKEFPADTGILVSITRTGGSPASNADLATALAAAFNAAALDNIATVADDLAGTLTITGVHPGDEFSITDLTVTAPGTLTATNTVQPTGTTVQAGVVLAYGATAGDVRVLTGTDTMNNVAGVSHLSADMLDNTGVESDIDGFAPGTMVPLNLKTPIWMNSETAATQGGKVYVRRVAGSGETLGDVRNAGAGTARVETVTPTAVNDTPYSLRLDVNAEGNSWESYVIHALGDGSATATEICDDLRTQLAAITALTGVITGSGTATLILTGAAGVEFASVDIGAGALAVAETTAGTFETIVLKNAVFESTITASGLVKVRPNLDAHA